MTVMTVCGTIGADVIVKDINGKSYYSIPVAHHNGKEETIWARVYIPNFGQDCTRMIRGNKIWVYGKPLFASYEGKVQITLWSERYEMLG